MVALTGLSPLPPEAKISLLMGIRVVLLPPKEGAVPLLQGSVVVDEEECPFFLDLVLAFFGSANNSSSESESLSNIASNFSRLALPLLLCLPLLTRFLERPPETSAFLETFPDFEVEGTFAELAPVVLLTSLFLASHFSRLLGPGSGVGSFALGAPVLLPPLSGDGGGAPKAAGGFVLDLVVVESSFLLAYLSANHFCRAVGSFSSEPPSS